MDKRLLFEEDELVALTPKAFDTLLALVENRGSVLSSAVLNLFPARGDYSPQKATPIVILSWKEVKNI
jgi:hypothetical protein